MKARSGRIQTSFSEKGGTVDFRERVELALCATTVSG
jgi:hypothetical protein